MELGASLGTPAGLNLHLGYWGSSHAPFLFRIAGMYWGQFAGLAGAELDLGFVIGADRAFKQELSSVFLAVTHRNRTFAGAGLMYGFNVCGFMLRAGVAGGFGDFGPLQLLAQIGFVPLI
jgi:hypothetical protein